MTETMYNFTPYGEWVKNGGKGIYNAGFSVNDAFGVPAAEPQG